MTDEPESARQPSRRFSTRLRILVSIYGVLYLIFIIVSFIPSATGSPVGGSVPFDPFDLEGVLVKLLFAVFLVGYAASWKHEGFAGLVFILWYIGMWCLEIYIVAAGGSGGAIVMGFPLFILGVLFVVSWVRHRR